MKHTSMVLVTLVLTVLAARAGAAQEFWAHRVAINTDVAYGDAPLQRLDFYVQGQRIGEPDYFEPSKAQLPTLMWIHGGGWIAGDKGREIANIIPFIERGWNAVSVNYRQGEGTAPQAVDDVMCAYKWLTERLVERGQDPRNIVVGGASAGGHLALVVGMLNATADHPCGAATLPRAVINWFGITNIARVTEFLSRTRPAGNYALTWIDDPAKVGRISSLYSPTELIGRSVPPILTIHGTADSVVPFDQAYRLHDLLETPNELLELEGGTHSGFTDTQYQQAYRKIFDFLELRAPMPADHSG